MSGFAPEQVMTTPVDLTMEEAVAIAMHIGVTAGLVHSGRRWQSRDEIVKRSLAILDAVDPMAAMKECAIQNADLLILHKMMASTRNK